MPPPSLQEDIARLLVLAAEAEGATETDGANGVEHAFTDGPADEEAAPLHQHGGDSFSNSHHAHASTPSYEADDDGAPSAMPRRDYGQENASCFGLRPTRSAVARCGWAVIAIIALSSAVSLPYALASARSGRHPQRPVPPSPPSALKLDATSSGKGRSSHGNERADATTRAKPPRAHGHEAPASNGLRMLTERFGARGEPVGSREGAGRSRGDLLGVQS
ncbi:hypothetical protein AB1Y20_015440 [Prymnesium parvum]|uniref:Uncharacterized protein n=1 Tax=Prymnesium parvum TaxID=97485 RepID=A0AB34JYE2_PRYPA